MQFKWVLWSCAALVVLGTATFVTTTRTGIALLQFQPPIVAILDVERVFEQSEMRSKLERELQLEFESRKETLRVLDKEIERLEKEKVLVIKGSDEFQSLEKSILHKQADLKFGMERLQKDFSARRTEAFEQVYEVIYRKTREYVDAHQIDLVLQRQLTLQDNMPAWEAVFYFNPELDITEEVTALVNGK